MEEVSQRELRLSNIGRSGRQGQVHVSLSTKDIRWEASPSPDGRYLVWPSIDPEPEVPADRLFVSRGDASDLKAVSLWWDGHVTVFSNPLWFPDGRRWVTLLSTDEGDRAVVYDRERRCPVQSTRIDTWLYRHGPLGEPGSRARLLGWTQPGRVLAAVTGCARPSAKLAYRRIRFYSFNVLDEPDLREHVINVPCGSEQFRGDVALGDIECVELAPRANRLAWLIFVDKPISPIERFVGRWLPWIRPETWRMAARTTDLRGHHMREVGHGDGSPRELALEYPMLLRWMPDGKRLSFIYKDWLWTVPAE